MPGSIRAMQLKPCVGQVASTSVPCWTSWMRPCMAMSPGVIAHMCAPAVLANMWQALSIPATQSCAGASGSVSCPALCQLILHHDIVRLCCHVSCADASNMMQCCHRPPIQFMQRGAMTHTAHSCVAKPKFAAALYCTACALELGHQCAWVPRRA